MSKRPPRFWLAPPAILCLLAAACASPAPAQTKDKPVKMTRTVCLAGDRFPWITNNQAEDGSFSGPDGKPDLTATCLMTLALLGDGSTMRAGPDRARIKKAVLWLRAQLMADGTFRPFGKRARKNSTRANGLATYTIVEAAGLSEYRLLWKTVDPAVKALLALRNDDGGWSSDPTQKNSDSEATAWCALACMSARFFRHPAPGQPSQKHLVDWFHRHPAKTAKHAAMELLCRVTADKLPTDEYNGAQTAHVLADHPLVERLLAEASVEKPDECYWASNALFAVGGKPWKAWQPRLTAITTSQNTAPKSEHYLTWDPGHGHTRFETTSLRVLTLQTYYRFSHLVR